MVITISRETGSGGHTVGKMLAERLGYDFYDKEFSRGMLYRFFTGREWAHVSNYNLSVDTGVFTKTQTTEIILEAMKKYNGGKNNA